MFAHDGLIAILDVEFRTAAVQVNFNIMLYYTRCWEARLIGHHFIEWDALKEPFRVIYFGGHSSHVRYNV